MMFDNDFNKCVTLSQCEGVYHTLEKHTARESRMFLKRARNKRIEDIEAAARSESLRQGYLNAQRETRNRNEIHFTETYSRETHHLIAEAVAASETYANKPRAWLYKHGGLSQGISLGVVPAAARQLFKDYREAVKTFKGSIPKKQRIKNQEINDTDIRYNVAI